MSRLRALWELEPTRPSTCGGLPIAHDTSGSALGSRMTIDTAGPAFIGRGSATPVGSLPVPTARLSRDQEIEAIISSTIGEDHIV